MTRTARTCHIFKRDSNAPGVSQTGFLSEHEEVPVNFSVQPPPMMSRFTGEMKNQNSQLFVVSCYNLNLII